MEIGAQLYTVREHTQTLDGLAESLKKVADIGYKTVQISGTCPYDAAWLKARLAENGLRCVLTHIPADRITGETQTVAREHDVFGCDYVGLGWYGFDAEKGQTVQAFADTYLGPAKKLRAQGKYFMYHNHDGEFQRADGRLILEQLAEAMPSQYMGITLDTYWVQVGGADPARWLELLSGRIPCIHLKDCAYGRQMAVVGEGNLNFDRIFEKAEAGGTKYMLVEQDDCNVEDPFVCLKRSYEYLTACGFH